MEPAARRNFIKHVANAARNAFTATQRLLTGRAYHERKDTLDRECRMLVKIAGKRFREGGYKDFFVAAGGISTNPLRMRYAGTFVGDTYVLDLADKAGLPDKQPSIAELQANTFAGLIPVQKVWNSWLQQPFEAKITSPEPLMN